VIAYERALVSPTLLDLTEAFVEGQAALIDRDSPRWLKRSEWQEQLPPLIEPAEGVRDWEYGGGAVARWLRLAWWTAPAGPRHFRLIAVRGKAIAPVGPPLRSVYPQRIFFRRGEARNREWVFACPCGAVLPIEDQRNAGGYCIACPEPRPWPQADHLTLAGRGPERVRELASGCRLAVPSSDGGVLARLTAKNRLIVMRLADDTTLLDHTEGQKFTAIALGAQGQALAAAGAHDVLEWRAEPGTGLLRLVATHALAAPLAVSFTSEGELVSLSRSFVWLGTAGPILVLSTAAESTRPVKAVALSPDGQIHAAVVAANYEGFAEAILCRRAERGFVEVWRLPLSGFTAGFLSPDARWLAWADGAGGIRLHDLENNLAHGRAGWSPDVGVADGRFDEGRLWLRLKDETIHPLPLSLFPGPPTDAAPCPLPPVPPEPAARPAPPHRPAVAPALPPPPTLPSVPTRPRETTLEALAHLQWLGILRRATLLPSHLLIHALGNQPPDPLIINRMRELVPAQATALALSSNFRYLAWATEESIRAVRVADGAPVFEHPKRAVSAWAAGSSSPLAFSPDGERFVFTLGAQAVVFDFGTTTLHEGPELPPIVAPIWSHAFTPSGTLATARVCYDSSVTPSRWGEVVYLSINQRSGELGRRQTIHHMQRGWLSPCSRYLAWSGNAHALVTVRDLGMSIDFDPMQTREVGVITEAVFLPGGLLIVADAGNAVDVLKWRDE
jgi:hypothetical protein